MEEVKKKISKEEFENLKKHPFFKGKIVSSSMSPVIKEGESIVVDVGQMKIKRFDIVVIYMDDILVCHYLWRFNQLIHPIYMQTRSLSGGVDIPITLDNYLGKVVNFDLGLLRKTQIFLKHIS